MPPKKKATTTRRAKKATAGKSPALEEKEKKGKKEKKIVWGSAEDPCKELLKFDLVSGAVPLSMKPMDVYMTRPEYSQFHKYQNFRSNLKSLKDSLEERKDKMLNDCCFYAHDLFVLKKHRANIQGNPHKPYPNWHSHEAKKLLKLDIKDGAHIGITPSYLWIQRQEYLEFPVEVFRQHVYQAVHEVEAFAFRYEKKENRFNLRKESDLDDILRKNNII